MKIANFECKFANMYDNEIYTKYELKPVVEDAFKVKDNIFCVADGVTRDTVEGKIIPKLETKQDIENLLKVYPNPSGAYESAKICVDNFVEYISNYPKEKITEELILDTVKKVNQDISKINDGRKIDYLKEDLYGCEAVGGIILEEYLYCFSIGDCHIQTFDKEAKELFGTINNHKRFEDYLNNIYIKDNIYDWTRPEDRVMVRRDFRNKPDKKYNGEEISFGVLTGEKDAEYYVDVYKVDLRNAKYIVAYSDGYEPYFGDTKNILNVLNNPESTKDAGVERTLIIYKRND